MNNYYRLIIAMGLCLLLSDFTVSANNLESRLDSLFAKQDYFQMNTLFKEHQSELSEPYQLLFSARINTVFNKQIEANRCIGELLESYRCSFPDSVFCSVFQMKLTNHINLYEYRLAADCSKILQQEYHEWLDPEERENLGNELLIWEALKDVSQQTVKKEGDTCIQLSRDKANLLNIPVKFGENQTDFIFDTGANFSVITRSLAEELDLEIRDVNFFVRSALGVKVESDVAVSEELFIGNIRCKNVLFLVFDDSALSFPQADYYIKGIIGYPVIEAFEEIQLGKGEVLTIPATATNYGLNNFALDGLMPVVSVGYQDDSLRFHFDTGANSTDLYKPFYKKYEQLIEGKYTREKFTSGSAGGVVESEGFVIPQLTLKIGGSTAKIDRIDLYPDDIEDAKTNFHGNLGQDFIKQFEKMIISFHYSSILFE